MSINNCVHLQKNMLPIAFGEGVKKAQDIGAASYCETSALIGMKQLWNVLKVLDERVKDLFDEAARIAILPQLGSKSDKCVVM